MSENIKKAVIKTKLLPVYLTACLIMVIALKMSFEEGFSAIIQLAVIIAFFVLYFRRIKQKIINDKMLEIERKVYEILPYLAACFAALIAASLLFDYIIGVGGKLAIIVVFAAFFVYKMRTNPKKYELKSENNELLSIERKFYRILPYLLIAIYLLTVIIYFGALIFGGLESDVLPFYAIYTLLLIVLPAFLFIWRKKMKNLYFIRCVIGVMALYIVSFLFMGDMLFPEAPIWFLPILLILCFSGLLLYLYFSAKFMSAKTINNFKIAHILYNVLFIINILLAFSIISINIPGQSGFEGLLSLGMFYILFFPTFFLPGFIFFMLCMCVHNTKIVPLAKQEVLDDENS